MLGRPHLTLILAAACWGLGTVISKRAVAEIPPLALLAIQLAVSVGVLSLVLRLRGAGLRDPSVPPGLGRLGVLNPGIAYALSLVGLTVIAASLSVLLWTLEPILILGLAAIALGERVDRAFVALSGLALAGTLLVVYQPGASGAWWGIAVTLAGVACCAVYTVAARRWLGQATETAPVVVAQQAWALGFAITALVITALVITALAGASVLPAAVSPDAIASALLSGVVYYGAAYWLYLSALRTLPASTAAASFYLVPVFGVAGGVLVLGEQLTPIQWAGAGLIVAAVVLVLRRPVQVA